MLGAMGGLSALVFQTSSKFVLVLDEKAFQFEDEDDWRGKPTHCEFQTGAS